MQKKLIISLTIGILFTLMFTFSAFAQDMTEEFTTEAPEIVSPFAFTDEEILSVYVDSEKIILCPVCITIDLNNDGITTSSDARLILRYTTELEAFHGPVESIDITADGEISAMDARLVLRYAAELDKYYRLPDGSVFSGFCKTINNEIFMLNTYGAVATGLVKAEGSVYYFENGIATIGAKTIADTLYYFDDNGKGVNGDYAVNGQNLYFVDGKSFSGYRNVSGKDVYYANGTPANGNFTTSGVSYYFENGIKFTGFRNVSGKNLYYSNGIPANGNFTIRGVSYYFENGIKFTGFRSVSGKNLYYSNGTSANGNFTISGVSYYFENGIKFTGFRNVSGKNVYYSNGTPANGNFTISGVSYYFENGIKFTGFRNVSGKNIYYSNGIPANGKFTVNGITYDFKNGVSVTGYKTVNGQQVYYVNGIVANGFKNISSDTYYFVNGIKQCGWKYVGGEYYYLDRSNGILAKNKTVDGIKVDTNGKAAKTTYNVEKIKTFIKAREILLQITDPSDTVAEKKLKCFQWVMNCPYKQYRPVGASMKSSGWEMRFANDIFINGKGCCGSTSAAFAFLAVEAGCKNVYFCDDGVSTGGHAWVVMEGNNNVYDVIFAKSKGFNKNYNTRATDYRSTPPRKTYIGG